jgi:hypothetical protein
MSEDHVRRFKLSLNQPQGAFNQSGGLGPKPQTKDNAQPVIPPPRAVFIPHPQLAPPGAVGVRLSRDAAQWMEEKRQQRAAERPFQSLVRDRDKGRGWER